MSLTDSLRKYCNISSHKVYVTLFKTPLGNIISAGDNDYLYMVCFEDSKNKERHLHVLSKQLLCSFIEAKNKLLERFETELNDYLSGKLKMFTVPIKMFGSAFQKDVWKEILKIPYASTQTYGDLAKILGRPVSHSRAIGAACGANGHIIVIPCHRLVAAVSRGGFSCGVDRKKWLIKHEDRFT